MKPDPYNFISELAAEYGPEAAEEVAQFERAHVDAIRNLVQTEKIDCDLVVTKAVDVQLDAGECRKTKASFDRLPALGVDSARQVDFCGQNDAEEVSLFPELENWQ